MGVLIVPTSGVAVDILHYSIIGAQIQQFIQQIFPEHSLSVQWCWGHSRDRDSPALPSWGSQSSSGDKSIPDMVTQIGLGLREPSGGPLTWPGEPGGLPGEGSIGAEMGQRWD